MFIASPDGDNSKIAGYYILSPYSIRLDIAQESIKKKFPKYPDIPTIMLGRLARSIEFKGAGVGEFLLIDSLKRAVGLQPQLGGVAVVTDPIDEKAKLFYKKFEFVELVGDPSRLYLSMETIRKLGL